MSPELTEKMRRPVEMTRSAKAWSRRNLLRSTGLGLIGAGVLVACGESDDDSGPHQLPAGRLRDDRGAV